MANLTSSLTIKLIDDVSKPARSVAQALEQASKQAKDVAKAMAGAGSTERFAANLAKLKVGAKDIETVSKAWREYSSSAKLAANASEWTKGQTADVRRWESQTIRALREVQKEEAAFARSQKRNMQSGGSGHGGPSQWGHSGALGFAAQGAAAAVSAHAVYHTTKSALEQGSEYQHERVALMNAGRTKDLARMEEAAKLTSKALPTASYTESLKAINETTSSFGSIDHAIENIGFVMRTAAVLKAAAGDKIQDDAGAMGQKYAKFFEMRGTAGNPELFRSEGDQMTRAMVATRGNFNPQEMFNFAQQAKSALRNYDIGYLSKIIPSIVGETGGERAGTGANAFNNVLLGKARDKKQLAEWMKYGLLNPKMVSDKHDSWTAGAVKGTDLAMMNPLRWFEEVALPAMKKKGVKIDDKGELTKVLATMFRNSMSNQFANENAQAVDRLRLHKDAAIYDQTDSPEDIYKRNLAQDPTVAIDALTESLKNLGTAASAPIMQSAAGAISGIAGALQQLAAAAKDHPVAAATAGGLAATGAMAGAGYLSYQFLNGFGLKTAAVELSGAAAALTGAAEKQGLGGLLGGGGAGGKAGAIGLAGRLATMSPYLLGLLGFDAGMIALLNADTKAHPNSNHSGAKFGAAYKSIEQDAWRKAGGHFEETAGRGRAGGGTRTWVPFREVANAAAPATAAGPAGHWENTPGAGRAGGGRRWVEDVKQQADEAKAALESVSGTPVDVVVTSGSMDALIAKIRTAKSELASLGQGVGAAARMNVPSLGKTQRGNFSFGGVQGE